MKEPQHGLIMTHDMKNITGKVDFSELRKRAQAYLSAQPKEERSLPNEDIKELFYKFGTYQIELEMQNKELRNTQAELEQTRQKYFDIYDFAPVAYLTISDRGLIIEANLTAAKMLGTTKSYLLEHEFYKLIVDDDKDKYYIHRKKLIESQERQTCELRISKQDGTFFYVQMESIIRQEIDGQSGQFRATLTDISRLKEYEKKLQKAYYKLGRWAEERTADLETMKKLNYILFIEKQQNLQVVLEEIVKAAIVITKADMGNIQLYDPLSDSLKIIAHQGFDMPFWKRSLLLGCLLFCCSCNYYRTESRPYDMLKKEHGKGFYCEHQAVQKQAEKTDVIEANQPLDLKQSIELAIRNNPDIHMAEARIKQASAQIKEAESIYWPRLSFYMEYLRGDAPSAFLFKKIDQRELMPQTNFNTPGIIDNFETGMKLSFNIFNGGRDTLNYNMAKNNLDLGQQNRSAIINNMKATVVHAYYNTLLAQDYIKIANESVETVKEQLRIMLVRYKEGGALKSDILTLKVRLALAKEDLLRSNNQKRIAAASLATILCLPPDSEFVLDEKQKHKNEFPSTYKEAIAQAIIKRSDLKSIHKKIENADMQLAMAHSTYLPRIDFQSRYYHDDTNFAYEREKENWVLAVVCNWDLFTGFSSAANAKKATAAVSELFGMEKKTLLKIKLDIKTAYLKYQEAKERLLVAQSSVAMAQESLSLVKKQYEGGSATITRYLEAELDKNRAKMRERSAFYDCEKATADIGRAIGLFGI